MNLYDIFIAQQIITTDSRNCPPGAIFFALKGDKFNANEFAASALENGCSYAVIDDYKFAVDKRYIIVDDVLKSLQGLATHHRKQMTAKVIGITGTNGKTTTKELIASVLKEKYKILYTLGNLNNHIGVPLTLLQIKSHHQLAIIELGANHQGEIKQLCEIALPDYGLVTNVGKAHLEGFGSFEGVIKTKAELYDFISGNGLGIFINIDNVYLKEMAAASQVVSDKQITYGFIGHPDSTTITGKITDSNPFLTMECQAGSVFNVNTQLVGDYNAENVLAAVTVGHFFDMDNNLIKKGLENYMPENNRSQMIITEQNKLIVDAYNANPTSMQAAIMNFAVMEDSNKTVILGEMLELGNQSLEEHQTIINLLNEKEFTNVLLVGKSFNNCITDMKVFNTVEELSDYLSDNNIKHHVVLIKGSRGVHLEKIIPLL